MKKAVFYVFLVVICLFNIGCGKTYHGIDKLLDVAFKEISSVGRGSTEMKCAGICAMGVDRAIVWFIYDDGQGSWNYLPMEVRVVGQEEYQYIRTHTPVKCTKNIAALFWDDGCSFVVNEPNCSSVNITGMKDGNRIRMNESFEQEEQIFVFSCPFLPVEYHFLDSNGNEID